MPVEHDASLLIRGGLDGREDGMKILGDLFNVSQQFQCVVIRCRSPACTGAQDIEEVRCAIEI